MNFLAQLDQSWVDNAAAWTRIVRDGGIASRKLMTDAAILAAVMACAPRRVLDIGCGEGWLARELAARGIDVLGVDGSAPLIAAAEAKGGATFRILHYDGIVRNPASAGTDYDVVVANFALLQDDLVPLLAALRTRLAASGTLVIQTVHPLGVSGPYRDGWREEDFRGFADPASWQPMPWYFRSFGSWLALLREAGFELIEIGEPLHPETAMPASLILRARPHRQAAIGGTSTCFG